LIRHPRSRLEPSASACSCSPGTEGQSFQLRRPLIETSNPDRDGKDDLAIYQADVDAAAAGGTPVIFTATVSPRPPSPINVDVDQPVVTLTGTVASALPGAEIVDISTALADDSVRLIGTSDALAPTDFFLI
jgi:hypothetical protein